MTTKQIQLIPCACECGENIPYVINTRGKLQRFKKGHMINGKFNPNWKGDNVGHHAIHAWVNKRLPKPELCPTCNKKTPYDLANISGNYLRDLNDWEWLCRACHMKLDHKNGVRRMKRDPITGRWTCRTIVV